MSDIETLIRRLAAMDPDTRREIELAATQATANQLWLPNPGPQTLCVESLADEVFYGGAAGGGKSSALCGIALQHHEQSILFRREFSQIKGLEDEVAKILGSRNGYNGQEKLWRIPRTNRILEFGSIPHPSDVERYQGRAHDFIGFDEICNFTEPMYRFLIGWCRSTTPGQRCRVICAGNPPLTPEGFWVMRYWGPWLDPTHPNPAKPGELRWFVSADGRDLEVDGPGPHSVNGRMVYARSRTYIPSRLEDNPDLARSGYANVLEALPEELRVRLRDGRFDADVTDDEFQVIPTAWVRAAQKRWTSQMPLGCPMTAIGVDVAQGGQDQTIVAARHDGWYAPLIAAPGVRTPLASDVAGLIVQHRRDRAAIIIDCGGGYGAPVVERLAENGVTAEAHIGANASAARTADGRIGFVNRRAELHWRFREALNPDQPGGSSVVLPPDPELLADLCAPRWKLTPRGIQIESKDDIKKRIGRSPDKGDAVILAWADGLTNQIRHATERHALGVQQQADYNPYASMWSRETPNPYYRKPLHQYDYDPFGGT